MLTGLLPAPYAYKFARIEPYGFFILVGLLMSGVLGAVLWPVASQVLSMLASVAGMKAGHFQTVLTALMN